MKKFLLLLFIYSGIHCTAVAQISNDSLINAICNIVEKEYVITSVIPSTVNALKQYSFPGLKEDALAKAISDSLFSLSHDKHLFVQFRPFVAENLRNNKDIHAEQEKREKREHFGIDKIKKLNSETALLRIRYFADCSKGRKEIGQKLNRLKNYKNVILDLRGNLGGNPNMLQLLCGYFLPSSDSMLLSVIYRNGRHWSLNSEAVPEENKLLNQRLIVLCDTATYSGGEGLTMILKNRKRAVVIGDKTAGAGNIGGPYSLPGGFVINIPTGVIIDALTAKSWEQIGVTPDVYSPSADAVKEAMRYLERKSR